MNRIADKYNTYPKQTLEQILQEKENDSLNFLIEIEKPPKNRGGNLERNSLLRKQLALFEKIIKNQRELRNELAQLREEVRK